MKILALLIPLLLIGALASAQSAGNLLSQSGAGVPSITQIAGNTGEQLLYGGAILVVALIIIVPILWWRKNKGAKMSTFQTGINYALIYSMEHNAVVDIKPFVVRRVKDERGNIEETRAFFADDTKTKKEGFIDFILSIIGKGKKNNNDEPLEIGLPFAEKITPTYKGSAWITVYSLETNTQLPLVTDDKKIKEQIGEMQRNVERRISRLKAIQLAIQAYVQASQPLEALGKMQLVGTILIFVGLIAVAYVLSQIAPTTATAITTALHQVFSNTTVAHNAASSIGSSATASGN